MTMPFDVDALRAHFPSLTSGIAHFDGPGGTQTPTAVGEAMARVVTGPLSNRGSLVASERNADDAVTEFRTAVADLLAAAPEGVVHGRSATQLTYDFSRTLAKTWRPGDEVVVTELDHDANIRPWIQAADRHGVKVRWLRLDPSTAELDLEPLDEVVNERTRLVAITGASNLLGTKPPVARIAARAHDVGALVYVDGVHLAAHAAPDMVALGADLIVCSPYKFFGPHCAALAAAPSLLETLDPDKLLPSTNAVPERFELGTLPYEVLAGVTAAVDFIADIAPRSREGSRRDQLVASHAAMHEHELRLRARLEQGLAALGEQVIVHSRAADRTSTVFFTFRDQDATDVCQSLAERDVLAPVGDFYACEPFRALGLPVDGGMRIGLAAYSTDGEIDRLLDGLDELIT